MSAHLVSPEPVGRSAEIGHLAGALDNAPATVPVGGEAGVGKSRIPRSRAARSTTPVRSIVDAGILVVDGDGYAFRHALHEVERAPAAGGAAGDCGGRAQAAAGLVPR